MILSLSCLVTLSEKFAQKMHITSMCKQRMHIYDQEKECVG